MTDIRKKYPEQVRFVFKHFPLPMHADARLAHLASLCAEEQGRFWEYRDIVFQNQRAIKRDDLTKYAGQLGLNKEVFSNCLDTEKYQSRIDNDIAEGAQFGVEGTPAFFVNGRFISGAQPLSSFQNIIDEELRKKK
jgi:protein-disulfide isomerase